MTAKQFFKSQAFKCIAVLLSILLVCGILLTVCTRRNAGIRFDDADPYYLVVASSESATRARIFMGLHPDVHLETVNNNGNIRVIAATGESPQALRDLHREKLAEEFPDAWPCHR